MKQISFPNKFVASFKQKRCVSQNAIVLADIDNDPKGDIELAVGGIGGELAIYKFNKLNPWKSCDGLGSINCLCVGDVRGKGQNALVVLTGEGVCFIFDVPADPNLYAESEKPSKVESEGSDGPLVSSAPVKAVKLNVDPVQRVHFSVPSAPRTEDSPGSSDRHPPKSVLKTHKEPAVPISSKRVRFEKISTKADQWFTDIIEPSCSHRCIHNANVAMLADIDEDKNMELVVGTSGREVVIYAFQFTGENNDIFCLVQKRKIAVPEKVHSLSLSTNQWGRVQLFVGQKSVGNKYVIIDHNLNTPTPNKEHQLESKAGHPVEVKHVTRPSLNAQGVKQSTNLVAIISLDGCILLKEDETVLWQFDAKQQLFGLNAFDLTKTQYDSIVVSSWDGTTYIIDQLMNLVEFQFEDQLSAFTAGYYSIGPGLRVATFIYVTFFDEIFVYHNIEGHTIFGPPVVHWDNSPLSEMSFQELSLLKAQLKEQLKSRQAGGSGKTS